MIGTGLFAATRAWQIAQREQFDPWTAWALSLVTPGAGHLLALRWTGFAWLLADGLLLRLFAALDGAGHVIPPPWQALAWLAMGLVAGEQARMLWAPALAVKCCRPARSQIIEHRCRGRAISIDLELDVAMPHAAAWAIVSDVPRFQTIDPFHADITSATGGWTPGARLIIEHRALGMRWQRHGRLLSFHPRRGYAFSDLSPRGADRGFPHVFFIHVEPRGPHDSRIVIRVRGRWSNSWFAPPLGRLWVRFVMSRHARLLRQAFS